MLGWQYMHPGVFSFKGSLLTLLKSYDLLWTVSGHHSVLELYVETLDMLIINVPDEMLNFKTMFPMSSLKIM